MATNLTLGTTFTADIQQFLAGINQIKNSLTSLQQSFVSTGNGAAAMGKGLAAAINSTTTAVQKQTQAIRTQQGQLTGLAGMWQRVQQAMKTSVAYGTAGAIIYEIIDGLKAGITTIADYDQALKNLQAITQATDSEMVGLADTIKDVSSKYVFSTKEISDGMVLMGQAGFTATQTMQATNAAAKLAMGTLEDMSMTVDLLTTTIVSFNMSAVESERVADVMANAMNRSKLTLDKLRVSFNYVGSIAHEAGVSLEETAAAMSVLSNAGLRASTIGTALRQVLQNVLAPNRRLREEFQGLGIDLSQLDPKIVGFNTVIQNLNKILIDQKTGLVDMTKAYNLFGLRAAQAAAVLARSANEDYPRMLSMMYEVGSATTMADKQMEGLIAQFKNLAANAQLIAIALGEGGVIKIFRMLADALVFLAKTIRSFVESGVGRLVTSWVAWSAATVAVTLALKGLITLLLSGLVPALVRYAVALKDVFWAMTAIQGLTIVDKIKMLLVTLVGGGPIFLAYAAAIGAVIAAYQYWKGAEERQTESVIRSSNAYKTAADTLSAYEDILQKLAVRQSKGQDVSVEYEATIKRLLRAYPQLRGVIDDNVKSLDKNIAKIEEYKQASLDKYIEDQVKLLGIYNQQINDLSFDSLTHKSVEAFGEMGKEIENFSTETLQMDQDFKNLSTTMGEVVGTSDKVVQSFGEMGKTEGEISEQSEKTKKAMQGLDQSFVNIGKAMDDAGKSTDDIVKRLRELGATEPQIKLVQQAIKKWSDDVAKEAQAIEAAMANLPHVFTTFFDTLDAGGKVAFAKAVKSMESEVSEYKKTAESILKTEEDRYAAEAFIRTKHLLKFADDVLKEKMTGEQLLRFKQNLLEEEKKLIRERIDEQRKNITLIYEDEIRVAGDNEKKKIAAQEKYQKNLETLRKKGAQAIVAIDQAANNETVESFKKTSDEVVKTGQKMANDYLNEMQRIVDETKKKIEQLKKAQVTNQEDLTDKIRGLKQKGMSDAEKFSDDESRINELLGKARDATYSKSYEEAKKYYDKAGDVAQSLARDVKNAQGETIQNEQDTARVAIRYLEQIKSESNDLYDQQISEEKKKGEEAKSLMYELTELLKNYGGEWDKLNQTKLKNFIAALDQIIGRTETLTEKTSNLRKDWEVVTDKLAKSPKPTEPSLGAQAGLGAVQKKEGGGTITVGGKTYDVNDLAEGTGTISTEGKTYHVGAEEGGTITVGGKTFDVKALADYENRVKEISEEIQKSVKESQESVTTAAETSGKQSVETVQEVSDKVTKAVEDASAGVETAQKSAQAAQTSMMDISNQASLVSNLIMEINNGFVTMGFNIDTVKNAFNEIKTVITELAQNPIEFITQAVLDRLYEAKQVINDIKDTWDNINSKEITLTVNQQGGAAGAGGGEGGGGGGNFDSYNASVIDFGGGYSSGLGLEYRKGGLVGRLNDLFQSIKQFAGGGRLPGYGGGDKQIIAAESGEYIVNKESTSKFLPMLQAINTNSVADFGKRFGGVIKSAVRGPIPAFESGGMVSVASSGGTIIKALNITIAPTYMSGDRASARRFAADVKQELDQLYKRIGVKK